jgi:steroid delta-isomerase-like uncharacterized protein
MHADEVVRRAIHAFNLGDRDDFRVLMDDEFIYREFATRREVQGAAGALAAIFAWREAVPDLIGAVQELLVAGKRVTVEVVWRGHQTGPVSVPGRPARTPTGATLAVPACMVIPVREGRMTEINHYFDARGALAGAGRDPVPVAA